MCVQRKSAGKSPLRMFGGLCVCVSKLRPRGRVCVAVRRVRVAAGRVCVAVRRVRVAAGRVCVAAGKVCVGYQSLAHKRLEKKTSNEFPCQKKKNKAKLSIAPVSKGKKKSNDLLFQ